MFGISFGIKGMLMAGAVSALVAGYAGWKIRDDACDAAALRVQLQIERDKLAQKEQDLKAANETAEFNRAATEMIEKLAAQREERIRELANQLKAVPAADRCPLNPARLKRLRDAAR